MTTIASRTIPMYDDGTASPDDSGLADEGRSSLPSEQDLEDGANMYSEEDDGADEPLGLSSENEDFFDGLPYETEQDSSDDDRDYNLEDFVDPQFLQEAQEEYNEEGAAGGIAGIQEEDYESGEGDDDVEIDLSASGDEMRTDATTEEEDDSDSSESDGNDEETQVWLVEPLATPHVTFPQDFAYFLCLQS